MRSRLCAGVGVDPAVEQIDGGKVLRVLQRAAQRDDAGRAAVVVLRGPVVLRARVEAAADRRQRDRLVAHQRVRLQALLQGRQIGQRLERRAGLALRLGRAIELAQRIGEAADHRQDAAGLVLEHHRRALHRRPDAQLRPRASCPWPRPPGPDDVVELETARADGVPADSGNMRPSVRPTRTVSPPPFAVVFSIDDRGRPMHVIERQPRASQRLLPGRLVGLAGLVPASMRGSRRPDWPRPPGIAPGRRWLRSARAHPAAPSRSPAARSD